MIPSTWCYVTLGWSMSICVYIDLALREFVKHFCKYFEGPAHTHSDDKKSRKWIFSTNSAGVIHLQLITQKNRMDWLAINTQQQYDHFWQKKVSNQPLIWSIEKWLGWWNTEYKTLTQLATPEYKERTFSMLPTVTCILTITKVI